MKIEMHDVTIGELVEGYRDEGDGGIFGYGGKLDIRPPYQREFVYDEKDREAVIDSVMNGFPLNVMYWVVREGGGYEVMDGQQRTVSIGQFVHGDFSYNMRYFHNLEPEERAHFLGYRLKVYFCSGTDEEKIRWFERINIAGKDLSRQEIRNAVYHGPWVVDAKRWFSKRNAPARKIARNYVAAEFDRQGCLETAIQWFVGQRTDEAVRDFMAIHQHDPDASELWSHFSSVITWIEAKFKHTSDRVKILKGLDWGALYAKYGKARLDVAKIEERTRQLLLDDEVEGKKGIIPYLLTGEEKHLNLRAFTDAQRLKMYERQGGVCPLCGRKFAIEEMHADHVKPWCRGGQTTLENGQMLCHDCNWTKGKR